MQHLKSLRDYIEALKAINELHEIDVEVDWNLEMGAICRRCYETGSPAPLFNTIKEIEPGFRVLGAPAGVSHQPGLYLARVALSLGFPPHTHGKVLVEALAAARKKPPMPPKHVDRAPCKENIVLGDDVDLFRLPSPLLHQGDGGRYLNTYGTIVVQTPDKKWTNWSIARIMLLDKTKMTGIVHPLQHVGMIHAMWKALDQPMPFALALGVEPVIPFVSGMPLPAFVNEADYIGGYLGEAIEVVQCETVDLQVPATAEIVIEGLLSHTETGLEGPMGEYAGYLTEAPGRYQPVYNVKAMTFRNNPILPISVAGEPVEENHTAWGIPMSAEILAELREQGLPISTVWSPLESAMHWLVVTLPRTWQATLGYDSTKLMQEIARIVFASKAGVTPPRVIVVNDDIDPTNLKELVWAFATRCHPGNGEITFNPEPINPLVAFLKSSEKASGISTKVVYNCLPPDEWGDNLPKRSSFAGVYPKDLQAKVLENWQTYGFR